MVKNPPAMRETWVRSLGWEDPLEEGMATHSSILAWRSLWTEEPEWLQSVGSQRVGHDLATEQACIRCCEEAQGTCEAMRQCSPQHTALAQVSVNAVICGITVFCAFKLLKLGSTVL